MAAIDTIDLTAPGSQKARPVITKQVPLSLFFTKKPVQPVAVVAAAAPPKRMGRPTTKAFLPSQLVGLPVPSPIKLVDVTLCVQETEEVTVRLVVDRCDTLL